jgi:hypothetical protein
VPPGEQGSSFGRGAWPWPCNEAERRMLPPRDGRNRSTTSQPEIFCRIELACVADFISCLDGVCAPAKACCNK